MIGTTPTSLPSQETTPLDTIILKFMDLKIVVMEISISNIKLELSYKKKRNKTYQTQPKKKNKPTEVILEKKKEQD